MLKIITKMLKNKKNILMMRMKVFPSTILWRIVKNKQKSICKIKEIQDLIMLSRCSE